jgi:hypothetical protein
MYLLLLLLIIINFCSPAQWYRENSIPEFTNIPSLYKDNNTIYAGADSVVYISTDNGSSWRASFRIPGDVDFVSAVLYADGKLFIGTYHYGVYYSVDNGNTWLEINDGLAGAAKVISSIARRGDKIYAGTDGAGIFVNNISLPGIWQPYNAGIPLDIASNIYSLKNHNDILYAGAGGNGYFYVNAGHSESWVEKKFGDIMGEPLIFYDINIDNGTGYILSSYGIFSSADLENWQEYNTSNGLQSSGCFVDAEENKYAVLMKAARTLWFKNNGTGWDLYLNVPGSSTLDAVYANGRIIDGRLYGLWYYNTQTSVDESLSADKDYYLSNNYPNPFNPTTKIFYNIAKEEFTVIKIYDVLGEEVSTLVSEIKKPGRYEIRFDAKNFSTGVYFCQMRAGSFVETKKMDLIR